MKQKQHKKRSVIKRFGGGGRAPTVTESIPAWAVPYLQNVGNQAQAQYGAGNLGKVAGASALQQQAFGSAASSMNTEANEGIAALEAQKARLAASASQGAYDPTALKDAAILESGQATAELGKQYGASGTLGSARQAVQQGAQNASTAAKFATIDQDLAQQNFQNKMGAESALGQNVAGSASLASSNASNLAQLGDEQRGIEQQIQDKDWQALQRYASTIYGNPARQSSTPQGGK